MSPSIRWSTVALATVLAAAARPLAGQAAAVRPAQPPIPKDYFAWDAPTKTMRYRLVAGQPGAKSPFNFNGYVDGELDVVVPEDATIILEFINEDGTPHSAEIIADKEPMPAMAGDAAIPRAYTVKASEGMGQGEKDQMRFKASPAGKYRIFCGVPGHGLSGMWIRFTVDPHAERPRLETMVKKEAQ